MRLPRRSQLLVYTVFTFMGIAAVWREPWVLDSRQLWDGWPNHEFT